MGQYHKLVNLDKQEQVVSYNLGLGAKQYEQTGTVGSMSDALYLLLMTSPARGGGDWPAFDDLSGRWVGDRVVVLGDYTGDDDYAEYPKFGELFHETESWTDISDDVAVALGKVWDYTIDTTETGWRTRTGVKETV